MQCKIAVVASAHAIRARISIFLRGKTVLVERISRTKRDGQMYQSASSPFFGSSRQRLPPTTHASHEEGPPPSSGSDGAFLDSSTCDPDSSFGVELPWTTTDCRLFVSSALSSCCLVSPSPACCGAVVLSSVEEVSMLSPAAELSARSARASASRSLFARTMALTRTPTVEMQSSVPTIAAGTGFKNIPPRRRCKTNTFAGRVGAQL